MKLHHLPGPIFSLLDALRARQPGPMRHAFALDACVEANERKYVGEQVRLWEREITAVPDTDFIPLRGSGDGSCFNLAILVNERSVAPLENRAYTWTFQLANDTISSLKIAQAPDHGMPTSVASFIEAVNAQNLEAMLQTLSKDALVNDQLREYKGDLSIKGWAQAELIPFMIKIDVVGATSDNTTCVVAANVDGTFDKRGLPDPLILTFYFSLKDDKIVQLIILRNLSPA